MKKKLLTIALAVMLALGCFVGLIACGNNVDGTYYVYVAGEKQEGMSMTLDGGKITTKMGTGTANVSVEGTYEVKDGKVLVTISAAGISSTQTLEIVESGILKDEEGMYYCVDGKTPPAEEAAE